MLRLPLGDGLLGRVVDAHGAPMDYKGPLSNVASIPLDRKPINAMDRAPVRETLDTGIRAINALLTVGRGQRLGLWHLGPQGSTAPAHHHRVPEL